MMVTFTETQLQMRVQVVQVSLINSSKESSMLVLVEVDKF